MADDAFISEPSGREYIGVMRAGEKKLIRVVSDEPNARFGRWGFDTDGKRLFYTRANWEADVGVIALKTSH